MDALIANARFHFHKQLFETNTLTLTTAGVASNADTSSRGSKAIARRIVDILVEEQHHAVSTVDKISGQTLGKQFETLTMEFLRETFPYLQNLRPGNWTILQLGNNNKLKTSDFAQYEHLAYLNALTTQNAQLAAALGNDQPVNTLRLTAAQNRPEIMRIGNVFRNDKKRRLISLRRNFKQRIQIDIFLLRRHGDNALVYRAAAEGIQLLPLGFNHGNPAVKRLCNQLRNGAFAFSALHKNLINASAAFQKLPHGIAPDDGSGSRLRCPLLRLPVSRFAALAICVLLHISSILPKFGNREIRACPKIPLHDSV